MRDEKKPMPPSSIASPEAIAVLEKWIADGMPKGTCSAGAAVDYSAPAVCTSKRKWTRGDHGSEDMHPGDACIACHEESHEREARIYTVAGTVYPTAHEPTDCSGIDGDEAKTKVVITDAAGKTFSIPVNGAGNFMDARSMKKPLRAKVVQGEKVYEMQAPVEDGDCNGCHTAEGEDGSPDRPRGRIVLP